MANVYIEPRPKDRREGDPIDDYVVEDHAYHVLASFKNAAGSDRVGQASRPHAIGRARQALERQEKAGSLALRVNDHVG
jgi:hypothetical protein